MSQRYSVENIVRSYVWLGHKGWTELNAFHPEYKQGRENVGWNVKHQTFPRVRYVNNQDDALRFVEKYCESRTVCYGLNPRSKTFKNSRGYVRSAVDSEIELVQNILFDFDFQNSDVTKAQLTEFVAFLSKANQYFTGLGVQAPARAYTGRGYHLLFAVPEIHVKEHPNIGARLKEFRDRSQEAFREDLNRLEAKLDHTQDLRRMLRIYGTAKPQIGIVSRFYGNERVPDDGLKNYLFGLAVAESHPVGKTVLGEGRELPQWFAKLLETDRETNELWLGHGKPDTTDTSGSGFDYSLTRRLLFLGYRNIDDLATVLSLRPGGSVQHSGKGEYYVRKTIAAALVK